jgi:excisionase family DNA binding protein
MSKVRDGQFCTVAEAARILEVSPSTVWRWIESRKLSAYRLGPRSIRIKREDVGAAIRPARPEREVTLDPGQTPATRPSPQEIARRKALVAEILELRRQAVIAPLGTADLVRRAREQQYGSYGRPR